jgi:hypothetical protein
MLRKEIVKFEQGSWIHSDLGYHLVFLYKFLVWTRELLLIKQLNQEKQQAITEKATLISNAKS